MLSQFCTHSMADWFELVGLLLLVVGMFLK